MPAEIRETRLLLVEGRDEEEFFGALLTHMRIAAVQVMNYAGKTRLSDRLPALLLTPGFANVIKLAVTRDADQSAAGAFRSIHAVLRTCGLDCPVAAKTFTQGTPPHVGVFILPGDAETGMLEDLCLQTVAGHPVMECVHAYLRCLEQRLPRLPAEEQPQAGVPYFPKNESKARVRAFLAGMHEPDTRLGIGGQKGYWDFNHPALGALKSFLEYLRD